MKTFSNTIENTEESLTVKHDEKGQQKTSLIMEGQNEIYQNKHMKINSLINTGTQGSTEMPVMPANHN